MGSILFEVLAFCKTKKQSILNYLCKVRISAVLKEVVSLFGRIFFRKRKKIEKIGWITVSFRTCLFTFGEDRQEIWSAGTTWGPGGDTAEVVVIEL